MLCKEKKNNTGKIVTMFIAKSDQDYIAAAAGDHFAGKLQQAVVARALYRTIEAHGAEEMLKRLPVTVINTIVDRVISSSASWKTGMLPSGKDCPHVHVWGTFHTTKRVYDFPTLASKVVELLDKHFPQDQVAQVEKWAGYVRNTMVTQGDMDHAVKVWRQDKAA